MNRRDFLIHLSVTGATVGLGYKILSLIGKGNYSPQPVLFFGHGSPMNAIEDNDFTSSWKKMGYNLNPRAIIVISAHWETRGTVISSREKNETIYDFGGFPQKLYEVKYEPKGDKKLAGALAQEKNWAESDKWGLDHGAWSVLIHAFPNADIPVIQLSIDRSLSFKDHWTLGQQLKELRDQGCLIVGSGNIVHNLRKISWDNSQSYPWAEEFQEKILEIIKNKEYHKLIDLEKDKNFLSAHPTPEHFIPLLYVFSVATSEDQVEVNTPKIELGSISMASFLIKNI